MKNVVEIMNFIYLLYPLKYLSVLSPAISSANIGGRTPSSHHDD
jgi:hypothetical protein